MVSAQASVALLIVHHGLRGGLVQLKLVTDFLEARSQRLNLLLLERESRLEFFALLFNFAVLFKKLVEQLSDSPQMLVNSN
jgi:hypothetical protein